MPELIDSTPVWSSLSVLALVAAGHIAPSNTYSPVSQPQARTPLSGTSSEGTSLERGLGSRLRFVPPVTLVVHSGDTPMPSLVWLAHDVMNALGGPRPTSAAFERAFSLALDQRSEDVLDVEVVTHGVSLTA